MLEGLTWACCRPLVDEDTIEAIKYEELMPIVNSLVTANWCEEIVDRAIDRLWTSIDNGGWIWFLLATMS